MTQIDTSKLVCPPRGDASQREWHLYRRFREEQDRAYRMECELSEAKSSLKVLNLTRWVMVCSAIVQAIILRTIPEEHVSAAVDAILEWMI